MVTPYDTTTYTYDSLARLKTVTAHGQTTSYTFDAVNNRLSKNDSSIGLTTYSYSVNDWLLAEVNGGQTTTYAYDANGHNLTKTEAGNLTVSIWN